MTYRKTFDKSKIDESKIFMSKTNFDYFFMDKVKEVRGNKAMTINTIEIH
jgi:hypothetical protein